MGDLKLVEKPQPVVLAPHDFCNIKASVKVASTENGIIFGNIVYDVSSRIIRITSFFHSCILNIICLSDIGIRSHFRSQCCRSQRHSYRYYGLYRSGQLQ